MSKETLMQKIDRKTQIDLIPWEKAKGQIYGALIKHGEKELAESFKKEFIDQWMIPFKTAMEPLNNLRRMYLEREAVGEIISPIICEAIRHRGAAEYAWERLEDKEKDAKFWQEEYEKIKKQLDEKSKR